MTNPNLRLEGVNTLIAPEITLRAMARHTQAIYAERLPEDPLLNEAALLAELRQEESDAEKCHLLLWDGAEVVASAKVNLPMTQNCHLAFITLSVLAPYRRRGLGKCLLAEVAAYAEQNDRRTLLTNASSRLPTGEAVLRRVGAALVMQQQFIQLDLAELKPDVLASWMSECAAAVPDYRLWQNQGAYPAQRLDEIANLQDVMNTAPKGERDLQDWQTTPEQLRERDQAMMASGRQRLTTFAEHRSSGELVALSELFWEPQRATLLFQHATAVRPEHRRHSLGRWIKAANLEAALKANPQARFVRAGNTADNTGMLRIIQALGFEAHTVHTDWQMDTADLRAYLSRSAVSHL